MANVTKSTGRIFRVKYTKSKVAVFMAILRNIRVYIRFVVSSQSSLGWITFRHRKRYLHTPTKPPYRTPSTTAQTYSNETFPSQNQILPQYTNLLYHLVLYPCRQKCKGNPEKKYNFFPGYIPAFSLIFNEFHYVRSCVFSGFSLEKEGLFSMEPRGIFSIFPCYLFNLLCLPLFY